MFELLAGSLEFHFGPYKPDRLFKFIAAVFCSALRQDEYAYSLRKKLQAVGVDIEEGTLYPLVRRLEHQGLLHSQWREGEGEGAATTASPPSARRSCRPWWASGRPSPTPCNTC